MAIVNGILRRLAASAAFGCLACAAAPTLAETLALLPPVVGVTEQQASDTRSGLGLSGYDPVAIMLDGVPRAGLSRYEIVHGGVAWRFASRANLAAFTRDPDSFLPRIGGYDAAAAAVGRLASADPTVFAARGGRLYLFRNPAERDRFLANAEAEGAAERTWIRIREGLVQG